MDVAYKHDIAVRGQAIPPLIPYCLSGRGQRGHGGSLTAFHILIGFKYRIWGFVVRCGLSNTILIITKGNTSWTISDHRAPVTTGRGVTPSFFPFLFAYIVLDAFAKLRKATISLVTSVRLFFRQSSWNYSAPTGRIFTKFDIGVYFSKIHRENSSFTNTWQE